MLGRYSTILYDKKLFQVKEDHHWLFKFIDSEYTYNAAQGLWFKTSYGELFLFEDVFTDIINDASINDDNKENIIFNLLDLKELPHRL